MSQSYIIETRSVAAGIVVRDRNRFQFFAADPAYRSLEGQTFRTPREAQRAVDSRAHTKDDHAPCVASHPSSIDAASEDGQ